MNEGKTAQVYTVGIIEGILYTVPTVLGENILAGAGEPALHKTAGFRPGGKIYAFGSGERMPGPVGQGVAAEGLQTGAVAAETGLAVAQRDHPGDVRGTDIVAGDQGFSINGGVIHNGCLLKCLSLLLS